MSNSIHMPLKECPFCKQGGAHVHSIGTPNGAKYVPRCGNPECFMFYGPSVLWEKPDAAAWHWNNRAGEDRVDPPWE